MSSKPAFALALSASLLPVINRCNENLKMDLESEVLSIEYMFQKYPAAFPRVPPPRTFEPTLRFCRLLLLQGPSPPPSLCAPHDLYDRILFLFIQKVIVVK